MKKIFGLTLLLPFLGISCSSGPYLPDADSQAPEAVGKKVVLFDEDLEDSVAVDRPPLAQKNAQNLLMVQVSLRNQTDKTLQLQVQTLFKDAKGMVLYSEVGNEAAWQSMVLSANETRSITQNALTSEASQYAIRVRLMKRSKN